MDHDDRRVGDDAEAGSEAGPDAEGTRPASAKRRYTRLTAEHRERVLDALSAWANLQMAAKAADVSCKTLGQHLRKDPQFRADCDEALRAGSIAILCALSEHGLLGPLPKGEEPPPVVLDADGIPIINARAIDVNIAKWLLSYHGKAVEARDKARAAEKIAAEKLTAEKARAPKGGQGTGAGAVLPLLPGAGEPLPSDAETDAVLAQVIAKFDAAARQKRHEARLRGKAKHEANRAVAQAKSVQKRRAAKRG